MNGQWIGSFTAAGPGTTTTGPIIVDLDDAGSAYLGHLVMVAPDTSAILAELAIPKGQTKASFTVTPTPIDRRTAHPLPNAQSPGRPIHTEWQFGVDEISIKWSAENGTAGEATLRRSEGNKQSELPVHAVSAWSDFKAFAIELEPYRFLFRGQGNNTWRLRTSFHRTGRASLLRFNSQDLTALQRQLSGLTTHRFNLTDALDNAAFLNLVQHHGYPTPLLDWTYSPFIGAYFAFRNLRPRQLSQEQKVRIFVLDGRQWNNDWERSPVIAPAFLHLTLLEPLAINNPRALPQQSVSVVTNVDDIETYVKEREKQRGANYLSAIDLPVTERRRVMQELALMGINAGSLFPGLDGACEQLRERYFDL
jgi:hypothetical protein